MKTHYGLQMYSIRDLAKESMAEALKTAKSLGFKSVEFAGFFGMSAEAVSDLLSQNGLDALSTHTSLGEIKEDTISATIDFHHKIGCENLIVPSANWESEELLKLNTDTLNLAQKILKSEGIKLHYHNHSKEFYTTSYGKIIHTELENRCLDLFFELDTFWVYNAGLDPLDLIRRLSERVDIIHLKDGVAGEDEKSAKGKALGEGNAPVKEVRKLALELGKAIVVESETLCPTGKDEVKRCSDYLKDLE